MASAGQNKPIAAEKPVDGARESRTPIRGVRRAMADAMVASAFTAPHVTEFKTVDVSASMHLLEQLRAQPAFAGIKLSPLTLLARAMCLAARNTPEINSSWDSPSQEIVTKHYVNLGIAAATDRGLLVPNIKDADQLTLKELALAIAEVVEAARTGKTEPAQMVGGTMSITNIGVFGIDTGTPILPPGESAIIALGAVMQRPWVVDGQIMVRDITTLALSFDHRLVDGAQGSKFLSDVALMLQEPALLLAWA
jgi:pyruvate dehydrogenase E2 component (dihydrolipoamide acetyltransferase)